MVKEAQISLDGRFLNTNSGFDASSLRDKCFHRGIEANIPQKSRSGQKEAAANLCFDEELYCQRTAIERTNAWLDGFKTLLVSYETNVDNWLAFHFLAFTVLLLQKILPE